ncbi:hypothetical protein E2562_004596 [Oryza meyeriana var. granulata]|uniref:Cullin family profile domain-containing protein n=1 Tax=Oryza meyeriana var. granulata TaxID=110450 RepID=A0A6G1F3N0_9ORYZ|nr:hypothetical protein E2562_004596 [Oryza meyeriana var. granulata]
MDYPSEQIPPYRARAALAPIGIITEFDEECLYGEDQSSFKVVVQHQQGKRFPPMFIVWHRSGNHTIYSITVVHTWDRALNMDEARHYWRHFPPYAPAEPSQLPKNQLPAEPMNQQQQHEQQGNQVFQYRYQLTPPSAPLLLLPPTGVDIQEVGDPTPSFAHEVLRQGTNISEEAPPAQWPDSDHEHEHSVKKRKGKLKRAVDKEIKRRQSERLMAKEVALYQTVEGKAIRQKKLKEKLAKCSTRLQELVSKQNLLEKMPSASAIKELASICQLEESQVQELSVMLNVVP